ncbi:metal-sensitive transcriptional regulator [Schaalia sp. ZJ405]|uniref:metal-sensitive transcriptional regulator n=1 Tax=unclassified Schaalia TaxID=2691889 RepID=UPI0013ED1E12|nr:MULTISPECIES: metal-sensitive transcriptional regulator [unclassified Schaalia]QPK81390.1 metal-sensitive transcriptional regulator [Schaalia sp. ZJ405]
MAHGYSASTDRYVARLRRIEGQIRGIQRMIDGEEYCIDILTQVSAAQSALDSVAIGLLQDHMSHCIVDAAKKSDVDAQEKIEEATRAIARLVKS